MKLRNSVFPIIPAVFIHGVMFVVLTISLGGCKSKNKDDHVIPALESYDNGVVHLRKGDYKKAAEDFERVFFQHPGSDITPQAELMQAYSLYLGGEYEETVDTLDIFIKLHPRHQDIAYAYYMRALSYYAQVSEVMLDQSRTRFAKEAFEEVIARFPGTKYAIDGALKMDLLNDHLAGKEMLIGRYYLKRKNPIAAIRRFQAVIDQYNTTSHVEEALYRLVETTIMLGLKDEAIKYAQVLVYNYPDGIWNQKTQNLIK